MTKHTETWTYQWEHVPTGKTGIHTQDRFSPDCSRHKSLADAISHWNCRSDWKYSLIEVTEQVEKASTHNLFPAKFFDQNVW